MRILPLLTATLLVATLYAQDPSNVPAHPDGRIVVEPPPAPPKHKDDLPCFTPS